MVKKGSGARGDLLQNKQIKIETLLSSINQLKKWETSLCANAVTDIVEININNKYIPNV